MEDGQMNPEKAQLKMLVVQGLGSDLDSIETGLKEEMKRMEGALVAYRTAIQKLEDHKAFYRDEEYEIETLGTIKKTIDRCKGIVMNLADQTQVNLFRVQGKIAGLEAALDVLEKTYNEEKAKLESLDEEGKTPADRKREERRAKRRARKKKVEADAENAG